MEIAVAYIHSYNDGNFQYYKITGKLPRYTNIDDALTDLSARQKSAINNFPFGYQSIYVFIDDKPTPNFSIDSDGNIIIL